MNEAKKQLLEKMGDTSAQSRHIQQQVMQKIGKRQRKKVQWPYYVTLAAFVATAILFFVIGPFANEKKDIVQEPSSNGTAEELIGASYKEHLRSYFMPHGSFTQFTGEGNEYASYLQLTFRLSEDYVDVITQNDGATLEKLYEIRDNGIYLLDTKEITAELDLTPSYKLEEIKDKEYQGELYLSWPVKVGEVVGDYKVVSTEGIVETASETMTDAIVLEQVQDKFIFRRYFVEGYGEVRNEVLENGEVIVYTMIDLHSEMPQPDDSTDVGTSTPPSTNEDSNSGTASDQGAIEGQMPEIVTLTSAVTGATKQFTVAQVEPIRMALQDAYDYEDEVKRMNFVELALPVSGVRYYLLRTACAMKHCNVYLMKEVNDELKTVPLGHGLSDDYVEFSPNMERALIRIGMVETSLVVRHQLAVVNLQTMQRNYAQTKTEYFGEATWPIEKYNWKDNTTIIIKVAEVFNSSFEALEGWRVNSGTLMDVEISFP